MYIEGTLKGEFLIRTIVLVASSEEGESNSGSTDLNLETTEQLDLDGNLLARRIGPPLGVTDE
jgi:hypothetical protein